MRLNRTVSTKKASTAQSPRFLFRYGLFSGFLFRRSPTLAFSLPARNIVGPLWLKTVTCGLFLAKAAK